MPGVGAELIPAVQKKNGKSSTDAAVYPSARSRQCQKPLPQAAPLAGGLLVEYKEVNQNAPSATTGGAERQKRKKSRRWSDG